MDFVTFRRFVGATISTRNTSEACMVQYRKSDEGASSAHPTSAPIFPGLRERANKATEPCCKSSPMNRCNSVSTLIFSFFVAETRLRSSQRPSKRHGNARGIAEGSLAAQCFWTATDRGRYPGETTELLRSLRHMACY